MVFIIVFAVISVLIVFLLLSWLKLTVSYNQKEGISLNAGVLFLNYDLIGDEKKAIKKKDYRINKFRRKSDKKIKKYRKKADKKSRTDKSVKKKTSFITKSPKELVEAIRDIFETFFKRFPGYLRIDCARLKISVGGEDAHKTAIHYGMTIQSVQYLVTSLERVTNVRCVKNTEISVSPDFVTGKWTADVKFVFKLRVIHVIKLGIGVIIGYFRHKNSKKINKVVRTETNN